MFVQHSTGSLSIIDLFLVKAALKSPAPILRSWSLLAEAGQWSVPFMDRLSPDIFPIKQVVFNNLEDGMSKNLGQNGDHVSKERLERGFILHKYTMSWQKCLLFTSSWMMQKQPGTGFLID